MGILEKISEIEKEIARTQKNKGIYRFTLITFLKHVSCFFFITSIEKYFHFDEISLQINLLYISDTNF